MKAWAVGGAHQLRAVDRPVPEPAPGEVRVRVSACGVCRTDLHLVDHDLPPRRPGVVPGHEIVGAVDAVGAGSSRFALGERIGIPWLRHTCGTCRFCRRGDENLCVVPRFTGWDDDGGYAEFAVVDEQYAYALPAAIDDEHAAPLLCSGIIGYRALRLALESAPDAPALGIYGFGASAHLALQVAVHGGARVHVVTRSPAGRALAVELGAASAGDRPPEPLDAAVLFAPAGELVPVALAALDRGGTLAVAGIHVSEIPALDYDRHLFQERVLRSVTANTRADGEEFLALAARVPMSIRTHPWPADGAGEAIVALREGRTGGAGVLLFGK